jgi:endonuclease/exonuclease/phosphatase family metal-dependent hydrolase
MKLITWNVQWFCGLDDVVSVERVLQEARAMADFDVLCLQEVAIDYPRLAGDAGFDQVTRVRELLPDFEVRFGAAVDELGRDGRRQCFGNLIASRLPVAHVQHHALPYPADGGVRSMPRMCTSATLLAPAGPVRVMTTHLEFYSARQRAAQAQALIDIHAEACGHALHPPLDDESGQPFQNKLHTRSAILCGDFNLETANAEYGVIQAKPVSDATRLTDAWRVLHGDRLHEPTFRLFDRRYGPEPIACDFVFVSEDLKTRVKRVEVNLRTRVSDHQPVVLELSTPTGTR